MALILILSMIINLVAVLAIGVLYSRQNRLLNYENNFEKNNREMEEIISAFIAEMKAENEETKKVIEEWVRKAEHSITFPNKPEEKEERLTVPQTMLRKSAMSSYAKHTHENIKDNQNEEWQLVETQQKEDQSKAHPLLAQVKQLYEEGKSIEEIAKELNRGKTEIDLWLKLNKL